MKCSKVLDLLEECIMGELDSVTEEAVKAHLAECTTCRKEYEETKSLITGLRDLRKSLKIKDGISDMNKRRTVSMLKEKKGFIPRFIPNVAACVFFGAFILSSTVMAFPSIAAKYTPELPIVKEMVQAREENKAVKQQIEEVKQENEEIKQEFEKLKIQLKEINGTEIREVQTSEGIPHEENNAIQSMVLDYIKAQFRGDIDTLKSMSTDEFKKRIDKRKSDVLMTKRGDVIFSQITNVAKEGDMYLVFVRLTDTSVEDQVEYQLNFEIKKIEDKFLVSFVGLDA